MRVTGKPQIAEDAFCVLWSWSAFQLGAQSESCYGCSGGGMRQDRGWRAPMLRFDLNPAQPALWSLGEQVAGQLNPGAKLGLLVPGGYSGNHADDEEYGSSLLRAVILFLSPRPYPIEIKALHRADMEALDLMQAAGYEQVLSGFFFCGSFAQLCRIF